MGLAQPRVEQIEGRTVAVVENRPPLQPRLDALLGSLVGGQRHPVRPAGARITCERDRTHRLVLLATGRHVGTDGVVRDLRLRMCADCGATEVRDVSLDSLDGVRVGRGGPLRRDHLIGWYSGARRNRREYR